MPEVRRGFICEVWNDFSLESLKSLDLYSIHIDHRILDETDRQNDQGFRRNTKNLDAKRPQIGEANISI